MTLPPELPRRIRQLAIQPAGLPEGDWAWVRDSALAALQALTGTAIAVFQVESYVMPFGQPEALPTGRRRTWGYDRGELALQFAERSRQQAAEFINAGAADELFVLWFSGQDDAESAHGQYKVRAG